MRLGIMQPYFFPYIGYWQLINYVDKFIIFDTPQYIRHGWINRNQIIDVNGNNTYITVPIKKSYRECPINRTFINNDIKWREKIWGQMTVYKKKSKFYSEIVDLVHEIIDVDEKCISKLNENGIRKVSDYLDIKTDIDVFSEMNIDVGEINAPDEWALRITERLGYTTYVNPPGGKSFFEKEKYDNTGIILEFLSADFENSDIVDDPFLSIIDMLMRHGKEQTKELLNSYIID